MGLCWQSNVSVFPGRSDGKVSAYNVGDLGSIPGSGRSPEEGNGNPLQYSCLENPWTEDPGRLQSMGSQRVRHDWAISLHFRLVLTFLPRSKCLLISWLQSPSAVILEPPKVKSITVSPSICYEVVGADPTSSLSSFTLIKRLFSSSLPAIRVVSSAYLRLLIFLPTILIPAYASSSPAFFMMYSAYKLNKQDDNIQPWCTPFPIWNQSVVPCPVLTVASWHAYRFLRRQVRWSDIPISFRIFHILLWFTESNALG